MPAGGQRPGLGLAVAHDASHDQFRIIESGAISMAEGVTQLSPFMNAARCFGRDMTGYTAREAELLEQPLHTLGILADLGIDFAVGAFEVGMRDHGRPAMPRSNDIHYVHVVAPDDTVEVHVQHVEAGARTPVAEQPRLDVLPPERFVQGGIVEQVDLPH